MDELEHAHTAIANHQEWKNSADEITYGMNCLYAAAEAAPILANTVIEQRHMIAFLLSVVNSGERLPGGMTVNDLRAYMKARETPPAPAVDTGPTPLEPYSPWLGMRDDEDYEA